MAFFGQFWSGASNLFISSFVCFLLCVYFFYYIQHITCISCIILNIWNIHNYLLIKQVYMRVARCMSTCYLVIAMQNKRYLISNYFISSIISSYPLIFMTCV
jgi:hypothetical protein